MTNVIDIDSRRKTPGYELTLEFDCTDDEAGAFVRGFECGMLSARLAIDPPPPVWNGTREMLARIAASRGYDVAIENSEDPTWVFATFTRKAAS